MNWNIMKHANAVMKWIEKHQMKYDLKWNEMIWNEMKYYEACSSSNEMNWNIMKHAVAVMRWIEKHERKYELKWNELKNMKWSVQ